MDCALIILVLKGQLSFISTWLHLGKWFMFQTFNSVLFKGSFSEAFIVCMLHNSVKA